MNGSLRTDPLLGSVPTIEGFKVLEPCVLYDRVGQGGMGVVYRARYLQLDIDVAVKCLKRSARARFPSRVHFPEKKDFLK